MKLKSVSPKVTTDACLTIIKMPSGRVRFTWYIPSAVDCQLAPKSVHDILIVDIQDRLGSHKLRGRLSGWSGDVTVAQSGALEAEALIRYFLRTHLLWPGAGRNFQSLKVTDLSGHVPAAPAIQPVAWLGTELIEQLRQADAQLYAAGTECDKAHHDALLGACDSVPQNTPGRDDLGRFFCKPGLHGYELPCAKVDALYAST